MQIELLVRNGADELVTTLIADASQEAITSASKFLGDNITIMAISGYGSAVTDEVRNTFEANVYRKQIVGFNLASLVKGFGYGIAYRNASGSLINLQGATVAAPATFTTGTITTSSIILNWAAVSGATNYVVEKASDAAFTDATQIYSGTAQTYTDSGLTATTTYYYRVRAQKTNYEDSAYKTLSAATV